MLRRYQISGEHMLKKLMHLIRVSQLHNSLDKMLTFVRTIFHVEQKLTIIPVCHILGIPHTMVIQAS
jgi:hypothetical protein